jgi:hypothetical protein
MLSAFTPRPIVELKPKEKIKFESILAFGMMRASLVLPVG